MPRLQLQTIRRANPAQTRGGESALSRTSGTRAGRARTSRARVAKVVGKAKLATQRPGIKRGTPELPKCHTSGVPCRRRRWAIQRIVHPAVPAAYRVHDPAYLGFACAAAQADAPPIADLIDALAQTEADLVVLTGDFMDRPGDEKSALGIAERRRGGVPRLGIAGVVGNHDSGAAPRAAQRGRGRPLADAESAGVGCTPRVAIDWG